MFHINNCPQEPHKGLNCHALIKSASKINLEAANILLELAFTDVPEFQLKLSSNLFFPNLYISENTSQESKHLSFRQIANLKCAKNFGQVEDHRRKLEIRDIFA